MGHRVGENGARHRIPIIVCRTGLAASLFLLVDILRAGTLKSGSFTMPRKVRELVADLLANGFAEVVGGGKGSHRKFVHDRYLGALTLSGQAGDDAKPYQEKQVRKALEEIHEDD